MEGLTWPLIGSSDHRVAQLPDGLDPELHAVAGLQEQPPWHAHAGWRSRQDEIAGLEGHPRREHGDLLGGIEDHLARARVMHERVVHPELQCEFLGYGYVTVGDEPRTEWGWTL